jgi:hypothetical protein
VILASRIKRFVEDIVRMAHKLHIMVVAGRSRRQVFLATHSLSVAARDQHPSGRAIPFQ